MIIISHPTGNTFVRAVLEGLAASGNDAYEFHTTIGVPEGTRLSPKWPYAVQEVFTRRAYPIESSRLRRHPVREVTRLLAARLGWKCLLQHESGWASVDKVYQALDRSVASRIRQQKQVTAVYAYEDGARDTFTAAREHGARAIYNLPIAYWETSKRLLSQEAERWPSWEPTLGGTRDSARKCQRKTAEVELADVVVCPSEFVLRSLPDAIRANKRCVVVPFGSPARNNRSEPVESVSSQPLRVLFAGSMSQRKGLADVFGAFQLLKRKDVELVVLGSPVAGMEFYRREFADFKYEPPRSHEKVLDLMRTCDLLVLPSIVEGRALVQQEAMSCGLPLLVTANAGAEDLVEEGVTGFLVPIRDPHALADRLHWFADHRSELLGMKQAAMRKAATLTWVGYWEAHRPLLLGTEANS